MWSRPPAESPQAMQLSVLARAGVPLIERYYLAVSLLLKAGSGRVTQDALERQCELTAQRMSLLYELNAPEFFERAQFGNFLDLARTRRVLSRGDDGTLHYDPAMLAAIVQDAQLVLHEQIRNSILQVVHR
jgi:glycerol-3-phosphate O-acyltransferase